MLLKTLIFGKKRAKYEKNLTLLLALPKWRFLIRDSEPPVTDYQLIDKSLVNLIKNQLHSECGVSPYRCLNPIHHHTNTHTHTPLDNRH